MERTIVTKSEFAARLRRSRSCVSGWLAEGKISSDALIGEGRAARIWLEKAMADLGSTLDPSQQVSRADPIAPAAGEIFGKAANERSEIVADRERDLARRAKADADRAEHDAESARRKLALDEGRYILAEEAQRVWSRELVAHIDGWQRFVEALAREIAEENGLEYRAVVVFAKEKTRAFRTRVAADARERRRVVEGDTTQQHDDDTVRANVDR